MTSFMRVPIFALFLIVFCKSILFAESFQIRTAGKEDADEVYKLICELAVYERKDVATLPLTRDHLIEYGFDEAPYFHVELAEADGQVVGYALYFYTFSAHQGFPVLYIEDLYVKPEYQKRGIGILFLKRLAALAKERNCCRLEGHVFDWNREAIAFYEQLGGQLRRDLILVRTQKEALEQIALDTPAK